MECMCVCARKVARISSLVRQCRFQSIRRKSQRGGVDENSCKSIYSTVYNISAAICPILSDKKSTVAKLNKTLDPASATDGSISIRRVVASYTQSVTESVAVLGCRFHDLIKKPSRAATTTG